MAADHSRRNASSFRRIPIPGVGGRGGSGGDARHRLSPPSLPLFSAPSSLSDHTVTNSSTLSSGSGGSSSARSGGHARGAAPDAAASASGRHAQGGKAAGSNSMASSPSSRRRQYAQDLQHKALSRKALMENDAMVYLDGPQVYTCGNCRTHLTSHDDIISKSFHGRHGRAYLFDQCVNITTGPAEDRFLITGLHSVSDIFCKRCQTLVGWTYAKAYEPSQKYKEGKFIIEKINLHLEESDCFDVCRPAGERGDRWRVRSMSWGSESERRGRCPSVGSCGEVTAGSSSVGSPISGAMASPIGAYSRGRSGSIGGSFNGGAGYYRAPNTPPARRSPGSAMMSPMSPRSPSGIIYEYRQNDRDD